MFRTRLILACFSALFLIVAPLSAAPPPGKGNNGGPGGGGGGGGDGGGGGGGSTGSGFQSVKKKDWSETHVRRVLHTFAYGGLATDAQIATWAGMHPAQAVAEMLTFDPVNEKLSPTEDASSAHGASLEDLQGFWGGDTADNPQRWDKRRYYPTLNTSVDGITSGVSTGNLQRGWVQAVNTRGLNPFLHKVGLYLSNYQLAISVHKTGPALIRDYYDRILSGLASGNNLTEVIAGAAETAATARAYGHQYNTFNNSTLKFSGNDDFAREFFQLYFRIQGTSEDPEYHEGVSIENNAMLLTGMNVDREPDAYGSTNSGDWWVAPIVFTDHTDATGRNIRNLTYHHANCLEILHTNICGATAQDKIYALAPVAAAHPESLDNLPVTVVDFFGDDFLDAGKTADIQAAWLAANFDLLAFLRGYAASTTFHQPSAVKYRSAFDRNLAIQNLVVLDNEESFLGRQISESPMNRMRVQGAEVFEPAHDVFGGQTGLQAANNPNIFKDAYRDNIQNYNFLGRTYRTYNTDATETEQATWEKDWAAVTPSSNSGGFTAGELADWLWNRLIGDGGSNFDVIARSQVLALLARGRDFGYVVTTDASGVSTDPEQTYNSTQLGEEGSELATLIGALAAEAVQLDSTDTNTRREANRRVGLAVNFITMMPYTFAVGGQ